MDIQEKYQQLIAQYDKGVQEKDPKAIQQFLVDSEGEFLKDNKQYYLEILQLRASALVLFGDLDNAGEELRKGHHLCSDSAKWIYDLNWALQYMAEFSFKRGEEKIQHAMQQGLDVLKMAQSEIQDEEFTEYYHLTVNNVKAFMLMVLGENSEAIKCYDSCDFTPVPIPAYNNKEILQVLFANYTKGFAVAIENKNLNLLKNLLKVISIDDNLLMNETNNFRLFYETLASAFDMRAELVAEFNALFRIKDTLVAALPNFSAFLTLIGEQNFDKLDQFFQEFK